MTKAIDLYLTIIIGDVDPVIYGPFDTELARDQTALKYRRRTGNLDDGIFMLDINRDTRRPTVYAYSGGFFEQETLNEKDYTTHT